MTEFLRNVSRRHQALIEGDIAAAMRQLGVGSQGGAEALAIFHQLFSDECALGSLATLLARIKVDEKLFWNDWLECSAQGGSPLLPQAHRNGGMEAPKLVPR